MCRYSVAMNPEIQSDLLLNRKTDIFKCQHFERCEKTIFHIR
jgi:hypothetical protein